MKDILHRTRKDKYLLLQNKMQGREMGKNTGSETREWTNLSAKGLLHATRDRDIFRHLVVNVQREEGMKRRRGQIDKNSS